MNAVRSIILGLFEEHYFENLIVKSARKDSPAISFLHQSEEKLPISIFGEIYVDATYTVGIYTKGKVFISKE